MPHHAARRYVARCSENAAEIKPVLLSALCDARQRALKYDVYGT